ncbi:MAG: hypothetical protein B7Y25_06820 [Alphaproteobacteria bacterium 16-39-46]|nr:MAG: hypothetical protein B7Y25_06820 [Alphaproteobacteria bacterium 16-39-46]OZA42071.1 MAG: hypothetical protein B7X84_06985 [Alphaproteobacteria bacterium 17-39-52]HQS84602.1 hypothetical protein [Alphaproteobacteria bacterium]HQS94418.1 hypothetical protein [Alphaproteobacteria bacterium]
MFHPHLKKICALYFLIFGGMSVFAMEGEVGRAVRAVSPAVVHLKGSNMEFKDSSTSSVSVLIENDGDFRTSADSSIKAPEVEVVSENVDLQGRMTASETLKVEGKKVLINGHLKAPRVIVIGVEHIELSGIIRVDQSESPVAGPAFVILGEGQEVTRGFSEEFLSSKGEQSIVISASHPQ